MTDQAGETEEATGQVTGVDQQIQSEPDQAEVKRLVAIKDYSLTHKIETN